MPEGKHQNKQQPNKVPVMGANKMKTVSRKDRNYAIQWIPTYDIIETSLSKKQAEDRIKFYEEEDKKTNVYKDNLYQIVQIHN